MTVSRRRALAWLLSLPVVLRVDLAQAFGQEAMVDIVELVLDTSTPSRPNAIKRLIYEVVQTTAVEADPTPHRLPFESKELFAHPFAILMGSESFRIPKAHELEALLRYLSYGGFLLVDDTSGSVKSGFNDSVRELVAALFPTRPLSPLPVDHSIYRSFFLIDRPVGRVSNFSYLEGVTVGNLTPLVYCRNDITGALDRTDIGADKYPCVPGGDRQRRSALKLALNILLYSLTANYKRDQAHVRQLILEGRLE